GLRPLLHGEDAVVRPGQEAGARRRRDGTADRAGRGPGRLQVLAGGGRGGQELSVPAPAHEGSGRLTGEDRRMTNTQRIPRRAMLRGVGAAVALPWLEAMRAAPVVAADGRTGKPPVRVVFLYHPLGAETTAWKGVTGEGRDMKLTPALSCLEPVKEHLLV